MIRYQAQGCHQSQSLCVHYIIPSPFSPLQILLLEFTEWDWLKMKGK